MFNTYVIRFTHSEETENGNGLEEIFVEKMAKIFIDLNVQIFQYKIYIV